MGEQQPERVEVRTHTGVVTYYIDGVEHTEKVEYTSTKRYRADGSFDNTIKVPRLRASGKSKKE